MESKAIGKGEDTGTSVVSHKLHISRHNFEQLQRGQTRIARVLGPVGRCR